MINTCRRDSLSSDWMGLSDKLIATFYEVEKGGEGSTAAWERKPGGNVVRAPLSDASVEFALNWQSPFENSGSDAAFPAIMAMLQAGAFQYTTDALKGGGKEKPSGIMEDTRKKLNEALSGFEGRTGITRLNSTQVFSGMPPVKIQAAALFRAWKDTKTEVEDPVNQLMDWALPQEISKDGSVIARMLKDKSSWTKALMPSVSPVKIAMHYKNRLYAPMVIESITLPIGADVDSKGRYVHLAIPMTLCSLTAIDRNDWKEWGWGEVPEPRV